MMIGMILFWALVIVGIVLVVRYLSGPGGWQRTASAGGGDERALEILDRRFAEGEISLEEYRERRAVLSRQRSAQG